METGEALRTLAYGIIDSYEMRVKTVNGLMNQAYHFLRSYQLELEDMIDRLRQNLARSESLRKKDFDRMMSDLTERRCSREKEAEEVFNRFQEEEMGMVERLRKIIVSGGQSDLKDMEVIREDILNRQKERETGIINVLKRVQIEQEELKVALRKLLSKGDDVKTRDFKLMLKFLRAQHGSRENQVGRILEDLDMARNKIQSQWLSAGVGY